VAGNTFSSIRTVTCCPTTQLLQSGQCSGGHYLILFSRESVLLASILFIENSALVAGNIFSSFKTETCWPATQPLLSGQCPVGRQLILFNQDYGLISINSTSSFSAVFSVPADPLQ
jgi:hypothetical protein